jgi:hypothetical protein
MSFGTDAIFTTTFASTLSLNLLFTVDGVDEGEGLVVKVGEGI